MAIARSNDIEIAYETFGQADNRPLLLIMGLSYQMIRWPDEFCRLLADRGHLVIRFDNRDAGLSTHFDSAGAPNIIKLYKKIFAGEKPRVPYLLRDMAADTVGLLDALGIPAAHLAGVSMGGMIGQTVAIEYPERILSLVSIMSSTGRGSLPGPRDDVMAHTMKPIPREREAAIEHLVETERLVAGDVYPADEERARDEAIQSIERYHDPLGIARQLAAIVASGSRVKALGSVQTRTLVIHGDQDPLLPIECGKDTAACIPGARFLQMDGMGHYLPRELWPRLVDAISQHTAG
jgi:pimeloyl-ACP methyl ester carboxylesterase